MYRLILMRRRGLCWNSRAESSRPQSGGGV